MHWLAWLPACLLAVAAHAVTVTDLYETAQPVEGSRDAAFVEALKTVAVRVSGQRDAASRLGAAINNPRKYVQRFGFTAEGVLEVGFDSVSIDQLLSGAGLPIWGHERPATLVLLSIDDAAGNPRWIGAESPSRERDVITRVARERGLPLKWPATGSDEGLGLAARPASSPAALLETAARYGANAVLIGRIQAGTSGVGGVVRWSLVSSDGAGEASGSLEDGVHLAADTFARVFAVSGSTLGSVMVEVSGISDLGAYATTLNYLESMTLVRGVALEEVAGDTMRFRLAVRGDALTLRRAIALDNRLVPQSTAASDGGGQLAFRYQP